jgi:aspartyl-tRNA(Asn)/glutamyl-tRNA(Gln) amidotransferase subunit A
MEELSSLTSLTLVQARKKLQKKEIKSEELLEAFIGQVEKKRYLHALVTDNFAEARRQAKICDDHYRVGQIRRLEGLPMAVKDLFCTKGLRTTACSRILQNFIPPYESTVTQRLGEENYLLLGKTNADEFACGSTTATSCFGGSVNPYSRRNDPRPLTPGGSSGGSAAAVAGNLCLAALGTDTGGSVRQPAALCHLVGLKPTYGRVSRYGIVAYASSLDQAGPITRDVADAAYLLDIIGGHDPQDSTSCRQESTDFYGHLRPQLQGKRVGIVKEFLQLESSISSDIRQQFRKLLDLLQQEGCEVVEVSIPTIAYVPEMYIILSYTELASNLARYDGVRYGHRSSNKLERWEDVYLCTRSEGFGDNIKKRIMLGYFFSTAENYEKYFLKAQKVRRKLTLELQECFRKVSLLLTPTTPQTAFPLEVTPAEKLKNLESNYLNDLFVCPVNMAGLPAISVPMGFDAEGLPIGMHFIGNYWDEQTILNAALLVEQAGEDRK